MKLNKGIIVANLLVLILMLFIFTSKGVNEETTMKALGTNIGRMDINHYILKNINIPSIELPINLNVNISETISCNDVDKNINILEYMKDGMENPAIVDYYQEDIHDVMAITNSKMMEIRYYEVDLNDDGINDLIVSLISPLHSGSQGDSFQILFGNGEYYLKNRISYTFRLYCQNADYTPIGQVHILPSKTNGYYNLEIFADGSHFFLKYQNGAYQYVPID